MGESRVLRLAHLFNPSSTEAAIALRQRLNETVDQLDELRHQHAELEVKFESQSRELTIVKSDRESCNCMATVCLHHV